jgi:hypothetical protein
MLQAYATQEILHKLGHDVEIIHFHPDYVENKNRRYRRGRSPKQYAIQAVEKIFSAKFKRRYEMFERFIKQRMVLTTRYASSEALLEAPPDFDTYICGSDQIWNMDAGGSKVHFLQFVPEGKRKISFSSSFGRNQIPEKYKDRRFLQNYLI